jgi:hypothetical protein
MLERGVHLLQDIYPERKRNKKYAFNGYINILEEGTK